MYLRKRKAFTMLELIFVVVVIGILSAIALPKFAMNRDDAMVVKAKTTVSAIRNSISTERQQRILMGNFNAIGDLSLAGGTDTPIFDFFDQNNTRPVLQYPLMSCRDGSVGGCWIKVSATTYTYRMPAVGTVLFTLGSNRFTCNATNANCRRLTQ